MRSARQNRRTLKTELSKEQVQTLGRAFWKLTEHYRLTREEQAVLLGIKFNKERLGALQKKSEIPAEPDKMQRVGNLLGIHKNLRILFPEDRDLVYSWMHTPHKMFEGQSPMGFIAEDFANSFARLFAVRRKLDLFRVAGF